MSFGELTGKSTLELINELEQLWLPRLDARKAPARTLRSLISGGAPLAAPTYYRFGDVANATKEFHPGYFRVVDLNVFTPLVEGWYRVTANVLAVSGAAGTRAEFSIRYNNIDAALFRCAFDSGGQASGTPNYLFKVLPTGLGVDTFGVVLNTGGQAWHDPSAAVFCSMTAEYLGTDIVP